MGRRIAAWRESYRADIAAHYKRRRKGHTHEYVQHPNVNGDWGQHVTCRICGFAVPLRAAETQPQCMVYEETP